MKIIKALVLFSGGLDSILAAKLLREQGIKVVGLSFASYFFDAGQARKAARELKIPLKVIDFSKAHLKIVQAPQYRRGKGMNPCIDCHLLMLKQAGKIMKQEGFDFVATGEVLAERPLSQNKQVLELIKRKSGLNGYLLRPLSARLLEETIPEENRWVRREKLLDISGRSRKIQIALAKKHRIKEYPTPAGGCLLCERNFSEKLKSLLAIAARNEIKLTANDFSLLKTGRHPVTGPGLVAKTIERIVLGRNKEENLRLEKLARKKDILVKPKGFKGPTALIRNYQKGRIGKEAVEKAKDLIKKYTPKAKNQDKLEFKTLRK